jgi:hypothetical protein
MAEAVPTPRSPEPDFDSQSSSAPVTTPGPAAASALGPQLPVVDLIGLRFSLQHLRLTGYGLLAVWIAELVTMLSAPDLREIASRLHYISQFLDLSPILLASIGLIAFQGGLRRGPLEVSLLPVLLCLLPLLSAFHLFLAPVTLLNAVTLVQSQEKIGTDQVQRLDQKLNRAAAILRESDDIDSLVAGLQRIPGLQVRVPATAPVIEARREVRLALERDRNRLRERIRNNLSASRDAFYRRAATNAALALLVGLVLWGLHRGAMREMQQSAPFLDWVLVHGEVDQSHDVLRELLRFQRSCLALGWFATAERCLGVMRRVIRPASEAEQPEDLRSSPPEDLSSPEPYPPPFEVSRLSILGPQRPPLFAPFRNPDAGVPPLNLADGEPPGADGEEEGEEEVVPPPRTRRSETDLPLWERWRRRRHRRLARQALRRQGESQIFQAFQSPTPPAAAPNPDPLAINPDPLALTPGQIRSRLRDVKRSRKAMGRLADQDFLVMIGQQAPPTAPLPPLQPPPPRRGLASLWRWLITHI